MTRYAPNTILVGMWNGPVAPGHEAHAARFRVLGDGRLRLVARGGWIDTFERVDANYGPLVVESDTPRGVGA